MLGEHDHDVSRKLNEMSLDIREVLTTLSHFNEKFSDTNEELKEIKETSKENQVNLQKITLDVNTLKSRSDDVEKDVEQLFSKFKDRDKQSDHDRKWIIGTVISVVVMFISLVGLLINIL